MKIIDGKSFECTKCGDCCRWEGYIFLVPDDIKRLADYHGMSFDEYKKRYTEFHGSSIVLKNKENSSNECVYLKDNKCSINTIKPKQCADYPTKFELRCPGFKHNRREGMSKYEERVKSINEKISSLQAYEKEVSNNLYNELNKSIKASDLAAKAIEEGIDDYFNVNRIKVANLGDLFSFNRVNANTLVHKSTKDLWNIEADDSGKVVITRLFSNEGEPIKG